LNIPGENKGVYYSDNRCRCTCMDWI